MPQVPTARGIKIRSASDAHLLFYAVHLNRLPIIQRRLDATERQEVVSGAVFIWEERSAATPQASSGVKTDPDGGPPSGVVSGIERWTDGLKWGPSRVRDDFLFYQEKDPNDRDTAITPPPHNNQSLYRSHSGKHSDRLVKQTYSVHYHPQVLEGKPPVEPARKWHLTAYHSPGSIDRLADVTSVPELQGISAPEGLFKKARVGKKRDNPPANGHSTSSSHGAAVSISNAPDNGRTVPSPDYNAPATGYGGGIGEVSTGSTSVLGTFGAFENGMQPANGMPPPHPHSHQHHTSSSSGYGLGGHGRQGSMDMAAPQMGHQLPGPNASQQRFGQPEHPGHQHHSSTGYSGHYDPRYGSQPPPPAVHSHGHSHSHGGSIGYGEGYGYGGEYGHQGQGTNSYGYDRDRPYSAAGRLPPHQLAPSAGAMSDPSYDPSRAPAPHHSSSSVPPPPISQLQHQHHRSHSHSYSNGHVPPSNQNGTPLMQYSRPQSQTYSTPMQQHSIPQPPMPSGHGHQRSYSTSSEIGLDGANGIRSPSAGAIRTKRGVNGPNRSDESAPLSTSSPVEGGRSGHFSPYARPVNAPGPRQHAAFAPPASNGRRHGTSSTGFEGGYGSGHFTPDTPYQPPGMPIAHSRSHSLPQHYSNPAIPPNPMAPAAPLYMTPHPPSQNGPPLSHYAPAAAHAEPSPFRPVDYSNPMPPATWSQQPISSPVTSLQSQSAYPYPAGSYPAANTQPSPHLAHTHPGGNTVVHGTYGATAAPAHSNSSVPPHMVPHLNPDHSPPMAQFREGSQSFGSVGSGGDGSPGSNRPPYPTDQYPAEIMSALAANGTGVGVRDGGVAGTGKGPRKVSLPPALDTSIAGSSSAPTSASSKLVPLTPLAHPARDPEDERVLDLLSRSAGGRGSGDAGSVASAGGIGSGMGEEGDGKFDE